jgi:hypothetical protein
MPNPWLNVHKSTAAMNYFFSNMTNTVIFMTLGYLRIRHTTAVPFSPKNIMTSPRLPLVKAQRSFLSGIRPNREQHGPKVKVTAPPKKKLALSN